MVLVTMRPSVSIPTTDQIIIEIPTVGLDGETLFPPDLGMGYKLYDNLVFDMYESSITMDCKVYPGNVADQQPTKIVCSGFSSTISTSTTIKFGFWIINPTVTKVWPFPSNFMHMISPQLESLSGPLLRVASECCLSQ